MSSNNQEIDFSKSNNYDWHVNLVKQYLEMAEWHSKMAESFAPSVEKAESDESRAQKVLDLTQILQDHAEEFGGFDKSIEEIVDLILE